MDIRKVQRVGGSSLSVSLPKDWVQKTGLQPGDSLAMVSAADGILLRRVTADSQDGQSSVIRFCVDGIDAKQAADRVVAAYLSGADRIEAVFRELPPATEQAIEALTRRISGFEVIERTDRTLVLRDLTQSDGLDLGTLLDRMYALAARRFRDTVAAIAENNAARLDCDDHMAEDLERLSWVAQKAQRKVLRAAFMGRRVDLAPEDVLLHTQATNIVQRIGHQAGMFATAVRILMSRATDRRVLASLAEVGARAINVCDQAARAFRRVDAATAEDAIGHVAQIEHRIAEMQGTQTSAPTSAHPCQVCLGSAKVLQWIGATLNLGAGLAGLAVERSFLHGRPPGPDSIEV